MQRQLRIATRSSALAMAQTNYVIGELKQECEIIKVSNEVGDVNLQDPLYQMPTVGVFTKQVEQYLLEQKADVAVHSLKDLPTVIDGQLYLAAYTKFEQRGDVVLLNNKYNYKNLNELPDGFKVGTSSLRRIATIRSRYPKLNLINIRGNLNTRIQKLDEGQYDAIILAKAGILRLGLGERISFDLEEKEFLYAPAQAALGIQCRKDDMETIQRLQILNDSDSQKRCVAERMFLNQLEGGCRLPIAVYSECREDGQVYIKGRVLAVDGTKVIEDEAIDHFEKVGQILCEKIKVLGGVELIESLKQQK
ncbi:unnamed protein product [Paramecium pentaurelia]|uniref:hydroxymethylbilane synthase n=1 Tax=Paramecium pentaurelia TaxID=43138 RepID=A0A8S1VEL4_9CILI|nr:unnamed protein product [Paramecium pentaurelia]